MDTGTLQPKEKPFPTQRHDPWLDRWLPLLHERCPGAHVLEIGCGNGTLARLLAPRCRRLVAMDCIPAAIRAAVLQGAPGAREVADRRAAIAAAIAEAREGDIVLIAGKGHEQGQIVGRGDETRILPFDDVIVARECAGILLGETR